MNNNDNEMAQILISRFVQAENLNWLHLWMDYGKHFIVALPSVQAYRHRNWGRGAFGHGPPDFITSP